MGKTFTTADLDAMEMSKAFTTADLDTMETKSEEAEGPPFWEKVKFLSPLYSLSTMAGPALEAGKQAYSVNRKQLTMGKGLTPWTPDALASDVTLEIDGKTITVPGWDSRLKARTQKAIDDLDQKLIEQVNQRMSEGKQWPVQKGDPWYAIDPSLIPETLATWGTSVGSQAAVLAQQVESGAVGAVTGLAATKNPVGAVWGWRLGQFLPNVENQTKQYVEDAEFWGISDKGIMEENARFYGLVSGLAEYAQNAVELAAAKGTLKLANTKAVDSMKRSLIYRGLKELGIGLGEGLTEVGQDGLERFFLRRAAGQMRQADPNFKMPNIPDTFAGWQRTFTQATGTAAFMRGAGHAAKGTMQHLYAQERKAQLDQAAEGQPMQPPLFRPEPRVMPQADVEAIDNEQLRTEGEELLPEEQAVLEQLESVQERPEKSESPDTITQDEEKSAAGVPKIVYHATTQEFEGLPTLRPARTGYFEEGEPAGIFYSVDPDKARSATGLGGGQRIIPAKVSSKKTFVVDDTTADAYRERERRVAEQWVEAARQTFGNDIDSFVERDKDGQFVHFTGDKTWKGADQQLPDWSIADRLAEEYRQEGYDAIYDARKGDLIVLDPEVVQPIEQDTGEKSEPDRMIIGGGEKGVVKGTVKPRLYIGNVTPRAKKVWAEMLNRASEKEGLSQQISPQDLGPHTEGPFRTKRTPVEFTVDEARDIEQQLTDAIDERLAEDKPFDQTELALLKAIWGDVAELRKALGLPVGHMPFKEVRAGKVIVAVIPNTTERIYVGIEGPNKRILADLSYSDLVTQGEAIKAGLKKAAEAARHAFNVGGKEAAAKVKAQVRELKRKARTIKIAKNARKMLVQKLTKEPSGTVDPYYRQSIQSILDRIDPTNRNADTQQRIDNLQAAVQRDPAIAERIQNSADQRLLKKAGQVPLNRMSTRQLEALVSERSRLEQEGRLKAKLTKKQRAARLRGFVADATAALKALDAKRPIVPGQEIDNATWFQKLRDGIRSHMVEWDLGYTRPDRFFAFLDRGRRGIFIRIWERLKTNLHTSRERRTIRITDFIGAMKDRKINGLNWSTDKLDFRKSDGSIHRLTKLQLIGACVQSQNKTGLSHLMNGNRFSETDLQQIRKIVEGDAEMASLLEWMMEQQKEQFRRVQEVCRGLGMDDTAIQEVEKYLPLLLAERNFMEQDDLLKHMLGQFVPKEILPKGFLKERTAGAEQLIELDAMLLYMHSSNQVEHFLAMASALKELGGMLANEEFREALNAKTHNHGVDILTAILRDVGRDRLMAEIDLLSRVTRWVQNHAVLNALAYNAVAVLRQLPAVLVGLAEDPRMLTKLVNNVLVLASPSGWSELRKQALHESKVLKHRNVEYEIRSAYSESHRKALMEREFGTSRLKKALSPQGMQFMRAVDDWCTMLIWKCKYDVILEEIGNRDVAIREADAVVQKTQQMASPEDLPHLFRGNTWHKIVNVFANQSNQEWNFLRRDIVGEAASGNLSASQIMYRVLMAGVLPGMLFTLLGSGGKPENGDDEDRRLLKGVAYYHLGNIPMMNLVVSALGRGRSGQIWQMPIDGMMQMAGSLRKEETDWVGFAKGTAKVVGSTVPTKGLVNAQFVRTLEGAWDLHEGNTDDARRLVWSKSMRGEKQSGKKRGLR